MKKSELKNIIKEELTDYLCEYDIPDEFPRDILTLIRKISSGKIEKLSLEPRYSVVTFSNTSLGKDDLNWIVGNGKFYAIETNPNEKNMMNIYFKRK